MIFLKEFKIVWDEQEVQKEFFKLEQTKEQIDEEINQLDESDQELMNDEMMTVSVENISVKEIKGKKTKQKSDKRGKDDTTKWSFAKFLFGNNRDIIYITLTSINIIALKDKLDDEHDKKL